MFCWGSTVNGELGFGGIEEEHVTSPRQLKFANGTERHVVQVGCGERHSAFLTRDGRVFTCGCNDNGQLGHVGSCKRPERVEALESQRICKICCGAAHTLAVNECGQIFSWGCNSKGQLGLGAVQEDSVPVPKIIKSLATRRAVQVACGANHSLALLDDGELYSWGCNAFGQLGLGSDSVSESRPQPVTAINGVPIKQIACGGNHSFALSETGGAFAWGRNHAGQLGVNDCKDRSLPALLKTLRSQRVTFIACGEDHTAALTQDGGVFTFGAGTYGQLGHGIKTNETVPRKVLELMGTVVTQIACGRRHSIALELRLGRLYAFGLGASGQLGLGNTKNSILPVNVIGPWSSARVDGTRSSREPSAEEPMEDENGEINVIHRVFCGGHRSFATVASWKERVEPVDHRQTPASDRILGLEVDRAEECARCRPGDLVSQDLISYLETVFASSACINGSFVERDANSLGCNGRNVALDRGAAETFFETLGKVTSPVILEVVGNCIGGQLIPSLPFNPPDVEALRLYVILPLCHLFESPARLWDLVVPFGNALLKLRNEAAKVLESWWGRIEIRYVSRLVRVYKSVVVSTITRDRAAIQLEPSVRQVGLRVSLKVLEKLNEVNKERSECVPYEAFYVPELTENVDVRFDYLHWLQHGSSSSSCNGPLYFCHFPFVFDAQAKTILMQTDAVLQMQNAMDEAYQRTFVSFFLPLDSSNPYLMLYVSRENLVRDTLDQLVKYSKTDLKKPLKVTFYGEEAVDAGGVRKEFFMLLLKDVVDPKYGMFKLYDETGAIWFNDKTFEDELLFHLIGILCGLAIYNGNIINLPFPLALYKKLLNEDLKLDDLRGLSPSLAKSLRDMLDYEGDDFEDVFMLKFEASVETFGQVNTYELKSGGSSISINPDNREEYVNLYTDTVLNKLGEKPYRAFHDGFHKVCGGRVLELFHAQELMAMIVGNEHYDWQELQENTEYKSDFGAQHPTVRFFWEVFHELTDEQKKKFLLFLTGYDRIPIFGMKSVKLTIQPASEDERFLPVAHTCFNLLDLPRYTNKETLRDKLLQAIEHCRGFALA